MSILERKQQIVEVKKTEAAIQAEVEQEFKEKRKQERFELEAANRAKKAAAFEKRKAAMKINQKMTVLAQIHGIPMSVEYEQGGANTFGRKEIYCIINFGEIQEQAVAYTKKDAYQLCSEEIFPKIEEQFGSFEEQWTENIKMKNKRTTAKKNRALRKGQNAEQRQACAFHGVQRYSDLTTFEKKEPKPIEELGPYMPELDKTLKEKRKNQEEEERKRKGVEEQVEKDAPKKKITRNTIDAETGGFANMMQVHEKKIDFSQTDFFF